VSVWLVTGASRGFGRELTAAALAAGEHVIATARDPEAVREAFPEAGDALLAVPLDVTDEGQAVEAVRIGVERFGRLDVVVNNAGYGLFGGVEEAADEEVRALFDTNVFGLLNVTRAALPVLRRQRAGRIINIGSSAGFSAGAGGGLYSATKFAIEAVSEALREEVGPLGIHVTIVEPGSFRTEFLGGGSLHRPALEIADYADTVGGLHRAAAEYDGRQPGDPARAAEVIRALAEAEAPPFRVPLGSDAVALLEQKLEAVRVELEAARSTALSTDFPA
jgi:NAD(P)-dependent dehydrogenase (short-subunit alcohol dehydrogenase family)